MRDLISMSLRGIGVGVGGVGIFGFILTVFGYSSLSVDNQEMHTRIVTLIVVGTLLYVVGNILAEK